VRSFINNNKYTTIDMCEGAFKTKQACQDPDQMEVKPRTTGFSFILIIRNSL